MGVETGGCPHTAIREDCSLNLAAIETMKRKFPALDLILLESGGDNLAATFSPELADITIYVIDVAAGEKIPRKGGPGITRSDLFVINKIDLAPHVGADLSVMETDTLRMRRVPWRLPGTTAPRPWPWRCACGRPTSRACRAAAHWRRWPCPGWAASAPTSRCAATGW
jgi:hypothetical protein